MLELEYGITDRWDMALYNLFDVTSDSANTGYARRQARDALPLACPRAAGSSIPIIYFEFQLLRHGDAREKFETKLIVARDQGPWNFAFNLAAEAEHLVAGGWVPETEYALGVSRELGRPRLQARASRSSARPRRIPARRSRSSRGRAPPSRGRRASMAPCTVSG